MSQFNQNLVFNGLGTISFTVPNAGPYILNGKTQLPRLVDGGGQSSLVTTVHQNGSLIYTGLAGADGFGLDLLCAVSDLIAITFASAAAPDQGLNVIKSAISISQGQ